MTIIMYKKMRDYENVNRCCFPGIGEYQIPELKPTQFEDCHFIGFNYVTEMLRCGNPEETGIHFFLDDYQFVRLWNKPNIYIPKLRQFKYVLTPDFSLYRDFPKALQIYNHYRKHWVGAYLQMHGISVIPTIGWSDETSYDWCFDGEPERSCVAVSSVGCMGNKQSKKLFLSGYREMIKRLQPTQIIFHGSVIPDECQGNIIKIKSFQDRFRKAEVIQ